MTLGPHSIQLARNLISEMERILFFSHLPFPSRLLGLMIRSCDVKQNTQEASRVIGEHQGPASFFCEGSSSKYFRLCRPNGSLSQLLNAAIVA